MQTGNCPV